MPEFNFQCLGANSATPLPGRYPSAFVLRYDQNYFLLDCGEGCQMKMSEFGVKRSKIDHIFISHLHGDHIFGLPGFLHSFNLNNRIKPLHLYGPAGISTFLEVISKTTSSQFNFELVYHELTEAKSYDLGIINGLKATAFPLQHRIATFGYRFEETPRPRNIKPESIIAYQLSREEIVHLKHGFPIERNGAILDTDLFLFPEKAVRSFAYCTDTIFDTGIVVHIDRVHLLYHEATYTHELAAKAKERMHSTSFEAASIARLAQVGKLVIGHYSSRYIDLNPLLTEARDVFAPSYLAQEGEIFDIF